MKERFINCVVDRPWTIIIISLFFALIAASGIGGLQLNSDVESMVDDDYQGKVEHYQVQDDFTYSNNIQIVVTAKQETQGSAQGAASTNRIFTSNSLAVVRQLTEDAWQLPYATRVDSITNYQHTEAEGDDLLVESLLPLEVSVTAERIDKVKSVALSTPSLLDQLISASGNLAVINVDVSVPRSANKDKAFYEVATYAEKLIEPLREQHADLDFDLSGFLIIDSSSRKYSIHDSQILIPLMLVLIIVLLAIMLRSVSVTAVGAFIVALTGLTTMGVVGLLGITLDTVSVISPIIIMTLAVADVVHVVVGMFNGMRRGKDKVEAIRYSMALNLWPVFLTSLTTALGVITFVFSDFPSLRVLGLVIGLGVSVAFILAVTLLPAILLCLPIKQRAPVHHTSSLMYGYVDWLTRNYRPVLLIGGLICVLLASQAGRNVLNESPEFFFKPSSPERQVIDTMKRELSGVTRFEVAIYTDKEGELTSPAFLQDIEDFSHWLRAQPGVGHVNTITDTFKRLNQNMHGGDSEAYLLPATTEQAAQYLLLYEMSLPYGLDLANQINYDKSATRIFITSDGLYAAESVQLKRAIKAWFEERNPDARVAFAGTGLMINVLTAESLMVSLMQGGSIALLMISAIMMLAFKQWKYGLAGAIANLLPVAVGYGLWFYIDGVANFAVMCVIGVCLGVVIDYAVHFVSKYRVARLDNVQPEEAVRIAFEKVALPLWTTTVALVAGFWVLNFSSITLNASLGLLTGIIIMLAFWFDMLILPALLLAMEKRKQRSQF